MLEIVPLALASAIDPILIASVAVMLSRDSPARLLVAYLAGGAGVSVAAGVLVVLALGVAGTGSGAGESPTVDGIAGAGLLVIAVVVSTGLARRVVVRIEGYRLERAGTVRTRRVRRPLLQRVRAGESPWVAWLAGVAWGVPGAFYLAALALIARSGAATAATVVTIVVFNVLMFALVEVPLVAFLVAPDRTRAAVQRFSSWMTEHRRTIVACGAGAVGVYLVVKGLRQV
jgi:hypothetical protein